MRTDVEIADGCQWPLTFDDGTPSVGLNFVGTPSSSSLIHSLRGVLPSSRARAPLRWVRRYEVVTEPCDERVELAVTLVLREGAECRSRRARARFGTIARSSNRGATFSPSWTMLSADVGCMKRKPKALSVEIGDRALANASVHVSEGETGSNPEPQGMLSPEGGDSGENMEKARVDVGVVGNWLQGVVGADESSRVRLDEMGAKCLREVVASAHAFADPVGADTLNLGATGEAAESEQARTCDGAPGRTGS